MDDPPVVCLILDTGNNTFLLSGKTYVLQIVGSKPARKFLNEWTVAIDCCAYIRD